MTHVVFHSSKERALLEFEWITHHYWKWMIFYTQLLRLLLGKYLINGKKNVNLPAVRITVQ